MRVPSVEEALRRLREAEGARLGKGASEREIAEAERRLGLTLPPGYRTFLRKVGWARLDGAALFGLGDGIPPDLDLLAAAAERAEGVARNLLPFARDDTGTIHYLDAAHSGPYESPVYRCRPGASAAEALENVGHDFASWLWMRLA
jgi:SMI1-KNR4 cell-wall